MSSLVWSVNLLHIKESRLINDPRDYRALPYYKNQLLGRTPPLHGSLGSCGSNSSSDGKKQGVGGNKNQHKT